MPTQIKITQLTDIGSANLAVTTLLPVVNMAGVPTTQKTTLGNLANVILSQSGGNYAPVATANIAYSVANAAQPNITSVGTLTNVAVSGNATVNGNITSNGTAYVGNLSTTGLASITTLAVGSSANLGAVANVRITGGTDGYVLQTDGTGNLTWTAQTGGGSNGVPGGSNTQVQFNDAGSFGGNTGFTFNKTTGILSSPFLAGNGNGLSNIQVANVSGLGNIATRNLDGNASNVLHGDGTWSADTTTYGNSNVVTLLSAFGSNTITTTGNVSVGNISTNGTLTIGNATITEINPIVLGFTDDIYVDGDVLSQRLKSNTGTVALNASNSTANTEWAFNVNGTLNLPQPRGNTSTSIQSIYSNSSSFVDFVSNNSANFTFGTTANHNIVLITGLNENDNRWVLGYDGNLTLPGNTFAVNYANGVQVSIGGGSGNTGNVTFDNNIVIGTGDEFGDGGLYLAPSPGSVANSAVQYLRVRGGDAPTHIHLDTGNNQYYDQYFGDDAKYVKLELGDAGNVVVGTDDATGNSYRWTFTSDGNLILANGNSVIQSIANSSLDPVNPNVSTMVLTPDPGYSTQSLVLDPTAPGHIHLRSPGANIDEPYANIFLGGEDSSFEVGYYNGAAPNVFIHSNTNTWTFENTGNLNFPAGGNLNFNLGGITQTINQEFNIVVQDEEDDGWSIFNTITDGLGNNLSQTQLDSGSFTIGTLSGSNTYSWSFEGNTLQVSSDSQIRSFGSNVVVQSMSSGSGGTASLQSVSNTNDPNIFTTFDATTTGANITVYNGGSNGGVGYTWQFANDGRLTFPGTPRIDTDADNFEVQAAENINFEANAVVNIYTDAGNTTYQWQFGDDGNLIVPGNTAISTSDATGGNAGNGITIKAGAADQSDYYTTAGGNLNLVGGLGATDDGGGGGPGGDVNIASGLSADPAGHAGNINITAGSYDWVFDYDGDLTLPGNLVYIGASPAPSIRGFSSVSAEQFTNDTSNVTINANSNTWNFDSTGNLILPANTFAINYANGTQVSLGGSNIANGNSNVSIATANGNVTISAVGNTTMTVTGTGANVTGTLTSTGKIGYASGSTVTQITSRGTGVTINALAGTIVTTSVAMVANEIDTFSVINSSVDPNNDIVLAQIVSPNQGTYNCIANPAVIGGFSDGFYINIVNISGFTTANETITIRFMVIKAPNA